MPWFVLGYLVWEEPLRTGEQADANRRTSENSVKRKFNFGEQPFHALQCISLACGYRIDPAKVRGRK